MWLHVFMIISWEQIDHSTLLPSSSSSLSVFIYQVMARLVMARITHFRALPQEQEKLEY